MQALNSRREMPALIASSARARRTGGFTMVEMLAVLLILTILVALAVGVGQHVIEEAKRKQTIATQEVVMQAIQAYYDNKNEYPDADPESDGSDDCSQLMKDHLVPDKDAGELLKGLDSEAYAGIGIDGTGAALLDAYAKEMRYRISGGLGGGPVLISAGKDGNFGMDEDRPAEITDDQEWEDLKRQWQKDDIRSDGR